MGLFTLIDGAHAPGHIPLDLDAVGCDYYAGNCHKWLGAPKGAAFLWARGEHHARLHAPVVSWGYCDEIDSHAGFDAYIGSTLLERRLQWQGTRDISAFLSVPTAIDFLERHCWPEVRRAGHGLAAEALERVGSLTGLAAISSKDDFGQMVAIPLPPCDPEELRAALFDRHRIEVPVTTHGGGQFVRPTFHIYNTRADLDALLAALAGLLPGMR